MRRFGLYILAFVAIYSVGCESETVKPVTNSAGSYQGYAPVRVSIMGLTEITWKGDEMVPAKLTAYIDLLDDFGSRMKSPAVFRLKVFEYVPRSSLPMGKYLTGWNDVNLYRPVDNDEQWQDHLRAYKFDLQLNFFPQKGKTYVFEATCITPSGRHLSDTYQVTYNN